jgi:hypothetical protein
MKKWQNGLAYFGCSDPTLDDYGRDKVISEREEDNLSAASSDSYRINESPAPATDQPTDPKSGKVNPDTSSTGGDDEDDKDLGPIL